MELSVYDSIDGLGPAALAPLSGGLDFSYGLLRAVERSLWGHLGVRYLAVEDGGGVAAFTPVYLGSNLNFNALLPQAVQASYALQVAQLGVGAAYTVAVVGSLISDRGGIPMHPELGDRRGALALLLAAFDELARESHAHLTLIKDVHESLPAEERAQMRAAGYSEGFSLPTIRIDTDYPSWEDYLSRHLSKNGRKHARKQFRHAEGRYALRTVSDFAALVPAVYPLMRRVFLKAKYQFEELPPRFFAECSGSENPQTELILCEEAGDGGGGNGNGGEIVGAMLVFYDHRQQLDKRIGVDYDRPDSGLIYNLLNYQGLIRAIERGIPVVELGQSAYLPKTRYGGELTDQYLMLKAHSAALKPTLPLQRVWMRRYRAEAIREQVARGVAV